MHPVNNNCHSAFHIPHSAFVSLFLIGALASTAVATPQAAKNPRVPATVKGYESADLYAKLGGFVKSVSVDIGDSVEAGQTLAIIDVPEMEKQLAQKNAMMLLAQAEANQAAARIEEAEAHLVSLEAGVTEAQTMFAQKQALYDFEQADYQRIARLASSGAIQSELLDAARYKLKAAESEQQSVTAKVATANAKLVGGKAAVRRAEADAAAAAAQVAVAQADIDYVNQMIEYSTIRAPWAGKITERMYDAGAFVQSAGGNSAAKPILKMVRDDKVRVTFSLSQKDLKGLEKGVKVSLTDIEALPGQTFEGTVSRYSAELDPKTRMMRVEMDLDNAAGKLKSGFFGYATVHVE
jgi:multidrug efflux pump subunit AcrA (membrane-fusion protein)